MFGLAAPSDDGITRPAAAEVYPKRLCTTIVRAFREQLRDDLEPSLGSIEKAPAPPTWTLDLLEEDPDDHPEWDELQSSRY